MIRTNKRHLVEKAVSGTISHPRLIFRNPWLIDPSGRPHVMPGVGGITYNVTVGDSALDFVGDHIEPGVSVTIPGDDPQKNRLAGLNILSCVGNVAVVASGKAAGSRGVVTGKHGGVEHVIVDFPRSTLDKLDIGDRIRIRAFGQGLRLRDFEDVHVMNLDPRLLARMKLATREGQLVVPVTHVIPASLMGSGLGSKHSYSGDYDIQTGDMENIKKHGLQNLRIGDIIAIADADCRFGRTIGSGATTIGVVVHGSCVTSGHGPGVTVLMTTGRKLVVPRIEEEANLSSYLGIGGYGRSRRSGGAKRRRKS